MSPAMATREQTSMPVLSDQTPGPSKEPLVSKRYKHLNRMCIAAAILMLLGVLSITIGTVAMAQGNGVQYKASTVGAAGAMIIMAALLSWCFVCKASRVPVTEKFGPGLQCLVRCNTVAQIFTMIIILFGLGFGGIWPFIECQKTLSGTGSRLTRGACEGDNARLLWTLALISLVMMTVALVLLLVLMCWYCSKNIGYVWVHEGGRDLLLYKGVDANEERLARGMEVFPDETDADDVVNRPPSQGGSREQGGGNLRPYNDNRPWDYRGDPHYRDDRPIDYCNDHRDYRDGDDRRPRDYRDDRLRDNRDDRPYRDDRPRDYRDDRQYPDDRPRYYRDDRHYPDDRPTDYRDDRQYPDDRPRDYRDDRQYPDDRPRDYRDDRQYPDDRPRDYRDDRPYRDDYRRDKKNPIGGSRSEPSAPDLDQTVDEDLPPTYIEATQALDQLKSDGGQVTSDGGQTTCDGGQTTCDNK